MTTSNVTRFTDSNTQATTVDAATVRNRLNHTLCEKINAINLLHQQSMNGYESDVQLLNRGVYYPPEYYFALKKMNQTARIEAFLKKEFFYAGYLSAKFFTPFKAESSTTHSFSVKKGVLPSDALQNIFEGLCLMGCEQVVQAAEYAAIQEVLGAEKFNALFSAEGPTPFIISVEAAGERSSPLSQLRVLIHKEKPKPAEIQKGDSVYFANHTDYDAKHLGGTIPGHHTICIDDQPDGKKFAAFGLPPGGLTSKEIKEDLLKEFNREPESIEYLPERIRNYFGMVMQMAPPEFEAVKKKVWTMEQFTAESGGTASLMHRLDVDKITRLANSSIKKSCKLFMEWSATTRS